MFDDIGPASTVEEDFCAYRMSLVGLMRQANAHACANKPWQMVMDSRDNHIPFGVHSKL